MVSTRQMTTTTGPGGVIEYSFEATASTSSNLSRPPAPKSPITIYPPTTQTIFLLDLPVELVEKIVSYTGYRNVAQLRTVAYIIFIFFSPFTSNIALPLTLDIGIFKNESNLQWCFEFYISAAAKSNLQSLLKRKENNAEEVENLVFFFSIVNCVY